MQQGDLLYEDYGGLTDRHVSIEDTMRVKAARKKRDAAMVVPDGEWEAVGRAAHAVIDEAKAAGVYVFGGGIDEDYGPCSSRLTARLQWAAILAPTLDGGFTVLELPSRDEAIAWAARIAKACRCDQELRVFGFDPQS